MIWTIRRLGATALLTSIIAGAVAGAEARTKYLACQETTWKGEVSFSVMDQEEFDARKEEAEATNKVLRKAYTAARRAWLDDAEAKGEAFPLKPPKPLRITRLVSYYERGKAEAVVAARQEKLEKKLSTDTRSEERKQTRLRGTALERYEKEQALLERAEKVMEEAILEQLGGKKTEEADKKGPKRKPRKSPDKEENEEKEKDR